MNNAVYFHYAPLVDMPEDIIDRMLNVGIKGTFWATQAATPSPHCGRRRRHRQHVVHGGSAGDQERRRVHVDQGARSMRSPGSRQSSLLRMGFA